MSTVLTTTPAAAPSAARDEFAPGPFAEVAARLYPKAAPPEPEAPPANIAALRTAEGAARILYKPEKQIGTAARELVLATNPAGTEAALQKQTVELANVAVDLGLDQNDLHQFAAFANTYQANPPSAEEKRAGELAAIKDLRRMYGADFDTALAAGQALAKRDPRFAAYLDATGLGSHPHVVLRLADLGLSERARGRL